MTTTTAFPPLTDTDLTSLDNHRPLPRPVLAQAYVLQLPAGTPAAALDRLGAALHARALSSTGHVASLPRDGGTLVSLWSSIDALHGHVLDSSADLRAWRDGAERPDASVRGERVLWWVTDGRMPDIREAAARLAELRRYGPGPEAFTLRSPVPPPATA